MKLLQPTSPSSLPAVGQPKGELRFILRSSGSAPAFRLAACFAAIAAREIIGRSSDLFRTPEAREAARRRRSARAARRLAATLGALKGVFVKAGQFASLRHDLLDGEVSEGLAALRDRVPPLPASTIRRCVERELAAPLAERFSEFDDSPLGAASIAQVHRARLLDGTPVAVKVQYPWIAASLPADLRLTRLVLDLWLRWSGRSSVDADRLFAEFGQGLAEELDFRAEALAAAQIAENLAEDEQVVVPRIFASHSSERVLTMSTWECVPINDRAAIERLGTTPAAVLEVVARAYAKQVFADGQFHADPHPGNLFVIVEPSAAQRPRVLFVDFGLCKQLAPALRNQLRQAIYAILQRKEDALLDAVSQMGMIAPGAEAGVRQAIAAMFEELARASGDGNVLGIGSSAMILALKDQAKALLQETDGLQLPNDLMLYAKTLSYLFALGEELDPEVDLMKISLPHVMKFLASKD